MNDEILTLERADELAAAAVAERGEDFVYNPDGIGACAYVSRQDPRFVQIGIGSMAPAPGSENFPCLVGAVLIADDRMTNYIASCTVGVLGLTGQGDIQCTQKVRDYLMALQDWQDAGETAGAALASARRVAGINS